MKTTRHSKTAAAIALLKALAVIALLTVTLAPAQAQTPNFTGVWTGTLTRMAPDGRFQTIDFMFNLTQKGKVLTGSVGPNAERQWTIEEGAVDGAKVTFVVRHQGRRVFSLAFAEDRLRGTMVADLDNGEKVEAKLDLGRAQKE